MKQKNVQNYIVCQKTEHLLHSQITPTNLVP